MTGEAASRTWRWPWDWAAVAFYAGYPAAVAAVLLLRSPSLDVSLPARTTAMEVFTLAALGWVVRAGVHPNLDTRTRRAAAIAYPVGDLALIFGVVTVLFRGASESVRLPLRPLALAMLVPVVGDTYLGYQRSHPGWQTPAKWQFLCWLTGHYLMAMAALVQCRLASGQPHGTVRLHSRGLPPGNGRPHGSGRPCGKGPLSVKRGGFEAGGGSAVWHGHPLVTVSLLPYLSIAPHLVMARRGLGRREPG